MYGQSDPAPMTALILFGMNSSSSQSLDLLQALRLGQFNFFPSLTSRLPIKKIYSTAQAFPTQLPTFASPKTLNLVATQQQKQCCKRQCYRSDVEILLQKTMLQIKAALK
jgi:hypothetical protein